MRIKITKELRVEILFTLKVNSFEVTNESQLCKIFDIYICYFEVFKRSKIIDIDKGCKIELLQWLKQGYIETDNSIFAKTVKHPSFLDIMVAASQV